MTTFIPIPPDLYRHAEPDAGAILPALTERLKRSRPVEQFDPNWGYVLTGLASTGAVVAALHCGQTDVPDHVWPEVMRLYCPTAWSLLTSSGVPFERWQVGRCEAMLHSRVAATANTELGGYAVFAVMDVPPSWLRSSAR